MRFIVSLQKAKDHVSVSVATRRCHVAPTRVARLRQASAGVVMRIGIVSETCAPEFTAIALTVHGFTAGLAARGHGIELIRPGRVTCGSATASAQRAAGGLSGFHLRRCNAARRPRPYHACPGVTRPCAIAGRIQLPLRTYLQAVGFSTLALAWYPALAALLLVFATLVAASRVILGLQYLATCSPPWSSVAALAVRRRGWFQRRTEAGRLRNICARRHDLLCGQTDSLLVHRPYHACSTIAVENLMLRRRRCAKYRQRATSACWQRRPAWLSTGLYNRHAQSLWKTVVPS